MKKYKYKYIGDFKELLLELFGCNFITALIIGVFLFIGMIDKYSIADMSLFSYIGIILCLWANGIINLLMIIKHTVNNIEKIEVETEAKV